MQSSTELRRQYLTNARRLVVKVGTNVLASPGKPLDEARIDAVSEQISRLVEGGREVVLVSSGAIGAGMAELGLSERPQTLPQLQAAASVGQGRLLSHYEHSFHRHGLHAGQMLLTREDFDARDRYLNANNTIHALLDCGCVPVINENDTVSTDEIRFGDNDTLAALVTHLVRAEVLILLSSVPGLIARTPVPEAVLSTHPRADTGGMDGSVADVVERVDKDVVALCTGRTSPTGTGGMESKLEAARIATAAGEAALIADGRAEDVLLRVTNGEPLGTLFLPVSEKLESRKRWIRFTSRPRGAVLVDAGAARAVREGGKSLLPSGVTEVKGRFDSGDVIRIKGPDGEEVARGLSNYSSREIQRIKGLNTAEIEGVLGHKYYDEIVHRDNMALLG